MIKPGKGFFNHKGHKGFAQGAQKGLGFFLTTEARRRRGGTERLPTGSEEVPSSTG